MRLVLGLTILLGVGALFGGALLWSGVLSVPGRFNPFAPLELADEPNLLTQFKLGRLEHDVPACFAVLRTSGLVHARVTNRPIENGCGLQDAVRVTRSGVAFNGSFVSTCALGVAWALFERHTLQPAAERHLGQPVARVVQRGTYACRNINHREAGRRSEHATANAIDISAFVLRDGSTVTVERDWGREGTNGANFLRALRDGACSAFDVVLGPDYNEAHRDHFHFDMGAFRVCR